MARVRRSARRRGHAARSTASARSIRPELHRRGVGLRAPHGARVGAVVWRHLRRVLALLGRPARRPLAAPPRRFAARARAHLHAPRASPRPRALRAAVRRERRRVERGLPLRLPPAARRPHGLREHGPAALLARSLPQAAASARGGRGVHLGVAAAGAARQRPRALEMPHCGEAGGVSRGRRGVGAPRRTRGARTGHAVRLALRRQHGARAHDGAPCD
mmetsp:Transcript_45331/g.112684  ORF Transcript_45331/g.112684 Transcript_45331/m.112684 type:complete len:218 (+) Transcript_45331:132-785(+)